MDNSLNSILSDRASWSKYDPAIQNYLAEMARKKDEEAAQLSQSNIYGNGTTAIAQSPDNKLSVLMQPESQPQQQMPQNYLRNNTTGATYGFNSVPRDQAGPALDYSSPIEIGGVGKGYQVKGDPFSVVLSDGRKVSLGNDSAATYQKQMQDLQMQKAKQALESGAADIEMKKRALQGEGTPKAPAGYRYTPEGNMEAIPGGPADQKAQAQAQTKSVGEQDVDIAIGTLRDAYNRLEKGGGITSTKQRPIENLEASMSSSGLGQAVGKMFGTANQSARNDIAMTRPALLAAMMKATGMSAKQMDSNAELKLWLQTATDPTLDVESNRRALDKLEQKYLRPAMSAPGANSQQPKPATGGFRIIGVR